MQAKTNAAELEKTREAALKVIETDGSFTGSRSAQAYPALVDRDKRIIELSFSSEHPYARDYGLEVLDHSPGSFDLEWLNSGQAPFMVAPKGFGLGIHEGAVQAGSIIKGSARVDSDRKGRARVLLSRSEAGDAVLNDIEDGVAVNISFDYNSSDPKVTRDGKGRAATVRWMKTKPRAITRVPLPADPTVGIGRDDSTTQDEVVIGREDHATDKSKNEVTNKLTTEQEQARALETARVEGIDALAKRFPKFENIATRCDLEGKSVEDTRSAILEAFTKSQNGTELEDNRGDDGAAKAEPTIAIFSSVKSFTGSRQEAGVKAYRFAKWFLASALGNLEGARAVVAAKEFCRDQNIQIVRSQTEGEDATGGFLVPHEFTNDMIELKELFGVFRRNVRVVPMASDTKSMPRRLKGLTAYVIGEGKGATESEKGWDRVTLAAKKIGALARYSSEIAEDGLVSMGDDLAREMAYAFTKFEDTIGFTGNGSVDHMRSTGILTKLQELADAGSNPGIITASGNTWDEWEAIEFLAAIGSLPEYAEVGNVKWYCSKLFWATVMQRIKFDLTGNRTSDAETAQQKTFLGYPVEVSQTLPKSASNGKVDTFIGNVPMAAMLGERRGITIATSEHVRFVEEEFVIRGTQRLAINVHNIEAIPEEKAEGVAGPIVGIKCASS